jgi:tryptophanyl-tRNA synthetase
MNKMNKQVILTGLRANNDLHIGHVFGAMYPIIDMAKEHSEEFQINMFIPDLHSFTTEIDHDKLQAQIMNNLKIFVAAGLPLDNPNVYIYRQSYVPAHSELTWILDCFTGFGELSRMTQFKDKAAKMSADRISVGLFNYPVLMAADILLYNSSYVPVGDDQTQHVEFARDIAQRLNMKFKQDLFVVPEPVKQQHNFFGKDQGLRIKDLADPRKKMSKSDETGKGVLFLSDSPDVARKKIMGATTDSYGRIAYNHAEQPGISNMMDLLALLSGKTIGEVCKAFVGNDQYGPLKSALAEAAVKFLGDFQSKLSNVKEDDIVTKLESSEVKMNEVANQTLMRVQKAVGLR